MDEGKSWRTWSSSLHAGSIASAGQHAVRSQLDDQAHAGEKGSLLQAATDGEHQQAWRIQVLNNGDGEQHKLSEFLSSQTCGIDPTSVAYPDSPADYKSSYDTNKQIDLPSDKLLDSGLKVKQWLQPPQSEQYESPAPVLGPATPATVSAAVNSADPVRKRQGSISRDDMFSSLSPKLDMLAHRLSTWAAPSPASATEPHFSITTPPQPVRPSTRSSTSSSVHDGRRSSSIGSRSSFHAADSPQPPVMDDLATFEEDLVAAIKRVPASMRYGAREGGGGLVHMELLQQLYARLQKLQAAHAALNQQLLTATEQLEARDKELQQATEQLHSAELNKERASSRSLSSPRVDQSNMEALRLELTAARQDAECERAARLRVEAAMERQLRDASAATQAETARLDEQLLLAQQARQSIASTTDVRAYITSRTHSSSSSSADEPITVTSTEGGDGLPQLSAKLVSDKAQQVAVVAVVDVAPAQHTEDMVPISLANQWRKALSAERAERQALAASLQHAKTELANTQQQAKQSSNTAREALAAAQLRVQTAEHKLQDADSKVNSLDSTLQAYVQDLKALSSKHVEVAAELQQEQETTRKLRLQVSVLEGSLEVLQRALDTAHKELAAHRQQQHEQEALAQTLQSQLEDAATAAAEELRACEAIAEQRTRAHMTCLIELRGHPYLLPIAAVVAAPVVTPVVVTTRPRGGLSDGSYMALMQGPGAVDDAAPAGLATGEAPTVLSQPEAGQSPEKAGSTSIAATDSSAVANTKPPQEPVEWHSGLEILEMQVEADGGMREQAEVAEHGESNMPAAGAESAGAVAVEGDVQLSEDQPQVPAAPLLNLNILPDSQVASAQPSPRQYEDAGVKFIPGLADATTGHELLGIQLPVGHSGSSSSPDTPHAQHSSAYPMNAAEVTMAVSSHPPDGNSDSEAHALDATASIARRARILSQGETLPTDGSISPRTHRATSRLARCTNSAGPSSPNHSSPDRTSMIVQHVAAAADVMRTLQEARQARARSHSGAAAAY